jgi:hypothetical protein
MELTPEFNFEEQIVVMIKRRNKQLFKLKHEILTAAKIDQFY